MLYTPPLPAMGAVTFSFAAALKAYPPTFPSWPAFGKDGEEKLRLSVFCTFWLVAAATDSRVLALPIFFLISSAFFWLRIMYSTMGLALAVLAIPSLFISVTVATTYLLSIVNTSETSPRSA